MEEPGTREPRSDDGEGFVEEPGTREPCAGVARRGAAEGGR